MLLFEFLLHLGKRDAQTARMIDDDFFYYADFYEERGEGLPRDKKVDEAKEALIDFFEKNNEDVYYMQQLEVFFEKPFFHWITSTAINELIDEGLLNSEELPLLGATSIKFVFNKRHRYYKRQIKEKLQKFYQKFLLLNAYTL